jgi:hypothetical protein
MDFFTEGLKQLYESLHEAWGPPATVGGFAGLGVGAVLMANGVFVDFFGLFEGAAAIIALTVLAALFYFLGALAGVGVAEQFGYKKRE